MTTTIDRAAAGVGGAPLDKDDKRRIAMLAKEAWLAQERPGFADQPDDIPDVMKLSESEAFTCWRQDEQAKACGTGHLTTATKRSYALLMAHFSRLAGREEDAVYWEGRAVTEPSRTARAKLRQELASVQDVIQRPAQYVATIARCKFRTTDLDSLSEKQLWVLVFDIRRAAQKRRANPC